MKAYSEEFKERMLRRMSGEGAVSTYALSGEVGVPESTLYRWKMNARGRWSGPSRRERAEGESSMSKPPPRPNEKSPEEKLRLLREAEGLGEEALGAFLRHEGLHEAHLKQWRSAALAALGGVSGEEVRAKPESKRVRELERELKRKDKALAETAALLVLKKKVQEIWGEDEEDDAVLRSGR